MTLEAGTYVADLNVAYPEGNSSRSQGDDHLRLIKTVLKNSFPNVTGAMTASHTELNVLDGITASTAELNKLTGHPGAVGTVTEIAFGAGLTGGTVTTSGPVAIDKADAAAIRAGTANKVITADGLESACVLTTLTDASTIAVNWAALINAQVVMAGDRTLGNPTNGEPGTTRFILVKGNNSTQRTLSFGTQYLGAVPVITNATSTRWYLVSIYCITSTHFVATSVRAFG